MKTIIACMLIGAMAVPGTAFVAYAQTSADAAALADLQRRIEEKRKEKEQLDAENRRLQAELQTTSNQARTLQTEVRTLDATQKKLDNDLRITESNIVRTELTLEELEIEIARSGSVIDKNKGIISSAIRQMAQLGDQNGIELFLRYENLNDAWTAAEALRQFQVALKEKTDSVIAEKQELERKEEQSRSRKQELEGYQDDLAERKVVAEQNKKAKERLLTTTKNREAEFKKQLAENEERGRRFETELFDFQAELSVIIDRSKLPTERAGVIQWPLDNITITQRFGRTVSAKRLYVSGSHNGVDFRAPMGTPVKSILAGVVEGVGNTDSQRGCYSYGRWILIKHANGLSSLYAHLSSARVAAGDQVTTGQVIGLSGGQPGSDGAGYSTGPHLHLSIIASDAVSIQRFSQSRFCQNVSLPISPAEGFLDPLAYLPALN